MKTKLSVLLAALLLFPALTRAQSDAGAWSDIMAVKGFECGAYGMARVEHRSYNNMADTECWFAMAGGGYNFTKWLKADVSYEYWQIMQTVTTHKAVLCANATMRSGDWAFAAREKYELAYNAGSDSFSHTLRTRFRVQYSTAGEVIRYTPYVMMEVFNGLGSSATPWVRNLHYAGCEFGLGAHHSVDLFYMFHLHNSGSAHILGIGYTFIF